MSEAKSWEKPVYQDCSDRNWDIYVLRERDGESFVRIADRYGLSATRVSQIVTTIQNRERVAQSQMDHGVPEESIDLRHADDVMLSSRRQEQKWALDNPCLASVTPEIRSMIREMFEVETDEDLALVPDRHLLMLRGITQPILDRMRNPLPYGVRHEMQEKLNAEREKCDDLRRQIRGLKNMLKEAHEYNVELNVQINDLRSENQTLRNALFTQTANAST